MKQHQKLATPALFPGRYRCAERKAAANSGQQGKARGRNSGARSGGADYDRAHYLTAAPWHATFLINSEGVFFPLLLLRFVLDPVTVFPLPRTAPCSPCGSLVRRLFSGWQEGKFFREEEEEWVSNTQRHRHVFCPSQAESSSGAKGV